ncbi:redoxin domain-containing protein [Streptomyces halobius]|uniref:Redoxin domain-containing protein n=1 Tax=Streptomyces halobius TaxID=2879846 RepID=A0ABY4M436_9ACTN|nr:redoxin domain-containing protein [Streptomyces halobius]UQA91948.1 redoxin domain-containing protein [Streptomyces halobius]
MRTRRFSTTVTATFVALALALLATGCGTGGDRPSSAASATRPVDPGASSQAAEDRATPKVPTKLDFTTRTVDGEEFKGASLAGKHAVLWFWAPWCTVCRSEAPTIAKTAAKWGDKVTFVGVPGRGRTADMKQFVTDTGLDGIQHAVDTDGSLWAGFGVTAQPALAFVDDDGTIDVVPGGLDATKLNDKVERLTRK